MSSLSPSPGNSSGSIPKLVAILGALVAFGSLSIDMYLPAFKSIGLAFGVHEDQVELSLTSFFVGLALGQLLYGPLADRFGRRLPLYSGLVLYALMSLACGISSSIEMLIVLRFFQAIGGCAGIVIARTIVRDIFSPQDCAKVFSLLLLVMGAAPILAPLLGGYITAWFSWKAIFFFQALFGLACLVASYKMFPQTRGPNRQLRLGSIFGIYLKIAHDANFMRYALAGGLAQAGMFAYITGSPYVLIELFGVPAEHFGWIFGTNGAGLIAASQINARLLASFHWSVVVRYAFWLLGLVSSYVVLVGMFDLGFWPLLIGLFLYVTILGFTYPNTAAGAMARQGEQAGMASALLGSIQFTSAFSVSFAVSHFHNHSAIPMTFGMGACGLLAFTFFLAAPCADS